MAAARHLARQVQEFRHGPFGRGPHVHHSLAVGRAVVEPLEPDDRKAVDEFRAADPGPLEPGAGAREGQHAKAQVALDCARRLCGPRGLLGQRHPLQHQPDAVPPAPAAQCDGVAPVRPDSEGQAGDLGETSDEAQLRQVMGVQDLGPELLDQFDALFERFSAAAGGIGDGLAGRAARGDHQFVAVLQRRDFVGDLRLACPGVLLQQAENARPLGTRSLQCQDRGHGLERPFCTFRAGTLPGFMARMRRAALRHQQNAGPAPKPQSGLGNSRGVQSRPCGGGCWSEAAGNERGKWVRAGENHSDECGRFRRHADVQQSPPDR